MKALVHPFRTHVRTYRAAAFLVWLMAGALLVPSCARVPPGLRTKIMVTGRALSYAKPLPRIMLSFTPSEPGSNHFDDDRMAYVTTDSTGSYSARLISGTYNVDVDPPPGSGFLSRHELVYVTASHARIDFKFEGCRVAGRVLGPTGFPVDSGMVGTFRGSTVIEQAAAPIEKGNYHLLLPAGRYSFSARDGNYLSGVGPQLQDSIEVCADTTIDFHLHGIPVSGLVLGPDGHPMKGVRVGAEVAEPGRERFGWGMVTNMTNADGRYQLYVPANSYWIWFRSPSPFNILPRVVGPVAIHEPASIDADLSGIEWRGTVRRTGASGPVGDASVLARSIEEAGGRVTSIRVDSLGAFRLILEPGLRYDLETYDRLRRERHVIEAVTASVDTTFEIFLLPEITASRADSTIKLSIRSVSGKRVHQRRRRKAPDVIETTFFNTGGDTVSLVRPSYADYWDGRAPIETWDIRTPEGERVEQATIFTCGYVTTMRADQIFRLAPGERKTFRAPVPEHYQYERGSHRHQFRLSYENRPRLDWRGRPDRDHNPDALRLLLQSTPCRLVSNTLELEVESRDR